MPDGGAPRPGPFQLNASITVGSTAASCGKESLAQASDQLADLGKSLYAKVRNAAGNEVRDALRAKAGRIKGRVVRQPPVNIRNPFAVRALVNARGATLPPPRPPLGSALSKIRIPPGVGARLLRGGLRGGIFSGLVELALQIGSGQGINVPNLVKAIAGGVIAALILAPFGLVGIGAILLGILVGVLVGIVLDLLFPSGQPAPAAP